MKQALSWVCRPGRLGAMAACLAAMTLPALEPAAGKGAFVEPEPTDVEEAPSEPPNIIWIMADDLGYGDLGTYGQTRIRTPHIDRMAEEGVRFTNAYAGASVCMPSRSVFLTGLHHGHTPVRWNNLGHLQSSDVTVAEVLRDAGYATAIIGKWGLGGPSSEGNPLRQGFDHFFGHYDQRRAHNHYPASVYNRYVLHRLNNRVKYGNTIRNSVAIERNEYDHDLFTDKALEWIEARRDDTFFLYLAFTIPHPNEAAVPSGNPGIKVVPEELAGHRERQGMEVPDAGEYEYEDWPGPQKGGASMITRLDDSVGLILAKLQELGIDEDTLVVFTSDNGPQSAGGFDPLFFNSSGSLRSTKGRAYEGGIRVPMIARWPGRVPARTVSDRPLYFADFLPTAAELAGVEPPEALDGVSFASELLGETVPGGDDRFMLWKNPGYFQNSEAARWGRWKLFVNLDLDERAIYDLEEDPGETTDVKADRPGVLKNLSEYLRTMKPPGNLWPVFTGTSRLAGAPNDTAVATIAAEDADDPITGYAVVGGADQERFEISDAGALSFKEAPGYEQRTAQASASPPGDAGGNEYVVEVSVTSGTGDRARETSRTFVVTVPDQGDGAQHPATASIAANAPSVAEGAAAAFTVRLSEAPAGDVELLVEVTERGSVLAGTAPTSATVAAGETSVTLTVETDDDAVVEGDGAVTATLSAGTGYALGSDVAAEVTVTDDDAAAFAVTAAPAEVAGGEPSTITVSIANGVTFATVQTITLSASGTAAGDDYALSASTLTLAAGESSATAELTFAEDAAAADAETVTVAASHDGVDIGSATVTRKKPPLTGSFENMPATHDGGTAFEFQARFSETIASSYRTLRDKAFTVTGGSVASATRITSKLWRIRVTPSEDGDVTIVLEANRRCSEGVCGRGGRRLSERIEATVSGPDMPEAPTITTAGPFAVEEGEKDIATLAATADDGVAADLVWSIPAGTEGGPDARHFALSAAGALAFTAAKDFEDPDDSDADGTYEVTAAVTDGENATTAALEVSLRDIDDTGPVLVDAAVTGVVLTLTFDEALEDGSPPPMGSFSVRRDGGGRSVHALDVRRDTVTLLLVAPVKAGDLVTVGYAPSQSAGTAALRDALGNAAPAFAGVAAANDTPARVPDDTGAPVAVSADWGLRPSDLAVGDQFRLLFVSSGKNEATSQDIADYDAFIRKALLSGHEDIREVSGRFRVLGSTSSVHGRNHTASNPREGEDGPGVPIYWLNGPRVANDYEDFYDDYWRSANPGRDESGDEVLFSETDLPWTGTSHNGILYREAYLGHPTKVKTGRPEIGQGISRGWILKRSHGNAGRLYGLSPVFEVGESEVPAAEFTVTANPSEIAEGESSTVTVSVTNGVTFAEDQEIALSTSGTASSADYTLSASTLTLAAYAQSSTATLAAVDDRDEEAVETVTVTANHDGGEIGAATMTIASSDARSCSVDTLNLAGNTRPRGLWSDGETAWVADNLDDRLFAYRLSDWSRLPERDIDSRWPSGRNRPTDLWSDGETLWAANMDDELLQAYSLSDGSRITERDVHLAPGNDRATGLWGDGETVWVLDKEALRIFAYTLEDGARREDVEVPVLAAESGLPWGLWGDGETLWTTDFKDRKLYAYRDGRHAPEWDMATDAVNNNRPNGLWSDGSTVWVSNLAPTYLCTYPLPTGPSSSSLTASFEEMPSSHTGARFEFRVRFSAAIRTSYRDLRDSSFEVTGGEVDYAKRVDGSSAYWRLKATPSGEGDVTIVLPADRPCSLDEAICAGDGRRLTTRLEATVAGPGTAPEPEPPTEPDPPTDPPAKLADGALRLVGSDEDHAGRVEVYHEGEWGTVCDDLWDVDDATVACRQLGYAGASEAPRLARFGAGEDPIWMDNLSCTGDETRLEDCPFNGWGVENCSHSEDAGVVCTTGADAAAATAGLRSRGPEKAVVQAASTEYDGPHHTAAFLIETALAGRPAETLEVLDLSERKLPDLWGVERLAGLRVLRLRGNRVSDLSPLAGLSNLRELDLSDNAVVDLSPLVGLRELRRLDISDNRVSDLAPLAPLPSLEVLLAAGNAVADVSPLRPLSTLRRLDLGRNAVSELGPLAALPRLRTLGLRGNAVRSVAALAGLTGLERLDLRDNALEDAGPLAALPALVWVDIGGNRVHDLSELARRDALVVVGSGEQADGGHAAKE